MARASPVPRPSRERSSADRQSAQRTATPRSDSAMISEEKVAFLEVYQRPFLARARQRSRVCVEVDSVLTRAPWDGHAGAT